MTRRIRPTVAEPATLVLNFGSAARARPEAALIQRRGDVTGHSFLMCAVGMPLAESLLFNVNRVMNVAFAPHQGDCAEKHGVATGAEWSVRWRK